MTAFYFILFFFFVTEAAEWLWSGECGEMI